MKRILVFTGLAVGVVSAALAYPANAPRQTGDVPRQMGNCLYQRYPARAQDLLQSTSADDAGRAYRQLLDDSICTSRVIGDREFNPDDLLGSIHLMRGMLAEQALAGLRPSAQALPALPVQQRRYLRPWFAATGRHPALDEMAACVADTNPAGVLTLLGTAPLSTGERAEMNRLSDSVKSCLSANTRLELDVRPVRAALADALYQRINNPSLSLASVPETSK